MDTIRKLLDEKGTDIWSIGPEASVYDAVKLMNEQDLGALAVVLEGRLVGMISERDCARHIVRGAKPANETQVREIMAIEVVYARPGQRMDECMAIMNERHIRHLPVMDGDRLVAMVSLRDLVNVIVREQNMKIEELETLSYYHGA
ncbi:MAG: CBS domain-containing protein [Gammaproteobacteria bacterium]|nr:CBS domain-containing protein [Gammaproteobacteria bacterium]NIN39595.1 CBS domain-containing protein [Gammaproteobacteria bacterium]NIO25152.1 CBS domain-containing protein [Gammaproteobacteria bacterium]NIO65781.1 CBS domain-containing protein [Gammaproteobacteria bacterium]NIP45782.1 CBS domain-containing protein [Gammaproteobacteria bacterium]